MQSVITAKQAKQITGGRTPLVPVEYESAVKALQACVTLDEAKYWDDKASALAAWAKIYRNDEAGHEAKRLKLHAYRRMGQLAQEIRPFKNSEKGPRSVLEESGLKTYQARAAVTTSKLPQEKFDRLLAQSVPPSPSVIRRFAENRRTSEAWEILTGCYQGSNSTVLGMAGFCRKHDPKKLARGLLPDEIEKARKAVRDVADWIDAFEHALPATR